MKRLLSLIVLILLGLSPPLRAEEETAPPDAPLKVAVILVAPFAIKDAQGGYSGLAVDIWREIAADNLWDFNFIPHKVGDFEEALTGVKTGKYDVIVGPTSSTADRQQFMDFSDPFYLDYVGAVVKVSVMHSIFRVIKMFLYSAGSLLLLLILFFLIHIHLIWLFERRDSDVIPASYLKGIGFVLWYQLSKNTYICTPIQNIKIPKTPHVKFSLLMWIVAAYVLTTLISATVVSFMTVSLSRSYSAIQSPDAMKGKVIGAVQGTRPYELGQRMGLKMKAADNFEEGLKDLNTGTVSAFLSDHSIAKHALQKHLDTSVVFSHLILRYDLYGFGLTKGSKLKHPINKSLLTLHNQGSIIGLCKEYIPESSKNCEF